MLLHGATLNDQRSMRLTGRQLISRGGRATDLLESASKPLYIQRKLTMNERSFIFPSCLSHSPSPPPIDALKSSTPPSSASPNVGFTRPACTTSVPKPGSASG